METTVEAPITSEPAPETRGLGRVTREGVKGLLKAQNILLDFAAEQNAIAFKIAREQLKATESSPATGLIDSVEEIFEGVLAMQKSLIDFGSERVGREPAPKTTGEAPKKEKRRMPTLPIGELLRTNFEAAVEAQRELLGLIEKQGKLGVKTMDDFAHFTAGKTIKDLASRARESVDNVIEAQAHLIDLAARQGKDSIELLAQQDRTPVSKELARHAEEAIDNVRRAQKKLLQIAGEMNERTYGQLETSEIPGEPSAGSKIAERLQNGIERAIKSQNELLDASLRAVKGSKTTEA